MKKEEYEILEEHLMPILYQISKIKSLARITEEIFFNNDNLKPSDVPVMLSVLNQYLDFLEKDTTQLEKFLLNLSSCVSPE